MIAINAANVGYITEEEGGGCPFSITRAKMFLGKPLFGRIINQHGLFSVHSKPDESLNVEIKGTDPQWYPILALHKRILLRGAIPNWSGPLVCKAGYGRFGGKLDLALRIRPSVNHAG